MTFNIRLSPLLIGLAALVLTACQSTVPYVRTDQPAPAPVVVADHSPERRALNEQVYDEATRWVGRLFYRSDFGGVDWDALTTRRREAVVAQPDEFAFYDSLNAVIETLDDRHTNARAPHRRVRTEALERGEAQATYGMTLRWSPDGWIVHVVRPDSPAGRAGVQVGWKAETFDGRSLEASLPPSEGRSEEIVFTDETGASRAFTLTAEIMPALPQHRVERLDGDLLLVALEGFDTAPVEAVMDAIAALRSEQPARGVILDLRGNRGGSLYEMTRLMGMLVREPMIATIMTGRFVDQRIAVDPAEGAYGGPLVVLVDAASVSAAEVLAAAFQESGRAMVMGEQTVGVVVASRHLNLSDGGRLSVGMQELRTPSGVVLEGRGVTPDVEIIPTLAQRRAGEDVILAAAVAWLAANP
ncbi:S41 family peptidase [Brevundimonas sp.]|uniref:S41 family peptidase n=1 Tax=Brevundimonas sp. TaxID=1871086 RepID=UPI001E092B20|nr:S41 family peptidase [Brevundimonas sp.]MBA4000196.1 hypothetical protein [Brevundimonas sp.]